MRVGVIGAARIGGDLAARLAIGGVPAETVAATEVVVVAVERVAGARRHRRPPSSYD